MQYTQLSRRSAGGKIDWEKQYLTFIPVEDAVFSWAERAVSGHLEYSLNGGQTWVTLASGGSTPTITAGSKVMWRGNLMPDTTSSNGGIGTFSASGNYNAYGNTMSLLFYDNYYGSQFNSAGYNYSFRYLFYNDTHLLSAPLLPATTLVDSCYRSMFNRCARLIIFPLLPATTLVDSCYRGMFQRCTSLTIAPELSATTLAPYCYSGMFLGCTSLTIAPNLPVITLKTYCYNSMFQECTSLTIAPELSATILVVGCYNSMFNRCTNLNYIKCLATDISASNCTSNWVNIIAATGTFVKAAGMTGWSTGANGIPSRWTVVDDNA